MGKSKRTVLLNALTVVMLVATVCLLCFYGSVAFNDLNPFPPPTLPTMGFLETAEIFTSAASTRMPTRTPTHSPTITPTPKPTNTCTPTPPLSVTPTGSPTALPTTTATPTPEVTRSPWPFTYELTLGAPQYGCNWTGVAGHVQDLDGNSLMGYAVHVWGAGIDQTIIAGADTRHNTIYGNQAAWEQFFDVSPKPMEVRVRLHDNQGRAISEEVVINLPGYCNGALGYIVFTGNHSSVPQPTPFLTPMPLPTRMVEAEWPERMEIDQSDYIRVSLVRTTEGEYVPTVEVIGHTVVAATAMPVGTPEVPIERAFDSVFGPTYKASAIAILEGEAFEISPAKTGYQSLEQDRITWDCFIRPLEPGAQKIIAYLVVQWVPTEGEGDTIERTVWRAPLEIEVEKPWIKTAQLIVLSPISGLLGLVFSAPWLYQRLSERGKKQALPGTTHVLSFDKLSPADFERLCLWLVEREGYERGEHLGLAGSEQGRDVIAYKPALPGEELWYFQCKRYSSIGAKTLKEEVDKYLQLAQEKPHLWPVGVVFVVSCSVSARVREEVGAYCEQHDLVYEFWALTELDLRVKRHADLLQEFFNLRP